MTTFSFFCFNFLSVSSCYFISFYHCIAIMQGESIDVVDSKCESSCCLWVCCMFGKSVRFSRLVMSDFLQPHGLQLTWLTYSSPNPRAYSNSCPSHWWCHPNISSSVIPFSSLPPSFPASGSFQMSQFFTSGGQSIGVSASESVLPMTVQDWFHLGWTGWISLQPKGLSRVFSNTAVQKH